jgi:hypothetical protein
MNYYDKYLKYKLKYLTLKENFSGGAGSGIFDIEDKLYKNKFFHAIFLINIFHILFFMMFGINEISKDLYDFNGKLEDCINVDGSRTFSKEYLNAYKLLISRISSSHFSFETSVKAIRPAGGRTEILHFLKVNKEGKYPHFSDDKDYLSGTSLEYHYTPEKSTHISDRPRIIYSINQEYKIDGTVDNKIKNIVSHCIGLLLDSDKSVIGISRIIKRAISFVSFGNKFNLFNISFFPELINSIFMSIIPFFETRVDGLGHKKELILLIKHLLPSSASKAEIDDLNKNFVEAKLEYQNLFNFTTTTRNLNFDFKRDSPFFDEIIKGLNKLLCETDDPKTFKNPFTESLTLVNFNLSSTGLSADLEKEAKAEGFESEASRKRSADEAAQLKLKEAEAARKKEEEDEAAAKIKAERSGHVVRKAMMPVETIEIQLPLSDYINDKLHITDEGFLIEKTKDIIRQIFKKDKNNREIKGSEKKSLDALIGIINISFFDKFERKIKNKEKSRLEILMALIIPSTNKIKGYTGVERDNIIKWNINSLPTSTTKTDLENSLKKLFA